MRPPLPYRNLMIYQNDHHVAPVILVPSQYQGISEFIATVLAWPHGLELPVSRIATLIVLLYIIYIYIFFLIPYHFYHGLFSYSSYCSIIMHLYIFLVSTLSRVSFLLLYIISMLYIVAILSLVWVRETK